MIKLSIIIPIYNGEEFIKRALDSIPVRDDIEVICIDDCSTDSTLEILKNYTRLPLKVFHNVQNMGIGFTTNVGINNATGEYFTGMDIDDYYITEIFEYCLDNLQLGADIYNFCYLENAGNVRPYSNISGLPGKWVRRAFIGDTRFRNERYKTDMYFMVELRRKPRKEVNLDIIYYRYNYPRIGSIDWQRTHGK